MMAGYSSGDRARHLMIRMLVVQYLDAPVGMQNILEQDTKPLHHPSEYECVQKSAKQESVYLP